MNGAPLISSQRYLDLQLVERKVRTFRVFVVSTLETQLRGRTYRVLLDGHHNLAAARQAGVEPTWRGPSNKMRRIMASMSPVDFELMLINNLTDSDWYFVEIGAVVPELLGVELEAI